MGRSAKTQFKLEEFLTGDLNITKLSVQEIEKLMPSLGEAESYVAQLQILKIRNNLPPKRTEDIIQQILSAASEKKYESIYALASIRRIGFPLNYSMPVEEKCQIYLDLLAIHPREENLKLWLIISEQLTFTYVAYNRLENARAVIEEGLLYAQGNKYIEERIQFQYLLVIVYNREGAYEAATEVAIETLDLAMSHGYKYLQGKTHLALSDCYKDNEKKMELLEKGVKLAKEAGATRVASHCLASLAELYSVTGRLEKGVETAKNLVALAETFENYTITLDTYASYVRVFTWVLKEGTFKPLAEDIEAAKAYILELMELANSTKQVVQLFTHSIIRAEFLFYLKEYRTALDVLIAFDIEKNIEELIKDEISLFYKLLYQTYEALGDFEKALINYIKYNEVEKEIDAEATSQRSQELRTQYETKEREAEVIRLQELEELKARFFSQITHELRTPLTLIKGPIQNILKGENPEPTLKNAAIIDRNADRLLLLVNQLLDVNKLEAGKMQVRNRTGYIDEFLNEIISPFRSLAIQNEINFKENIGFEKLPLVFDADKIQKIIYNLLSNAFKFTDAGGEVSIHIEKKKSKKKESVALIFQVKDSGLGISEEQLPKIFDRFYQADSSSTRKAEGTGIGLALVKEITELLGGEIKVTSKLNKGTNFKVSIDFKTVSDHEAVERDMLIESFTESESTMIAEPPKATQLSTDAPILLVVEDNEDMHIYIESIFSERYNILKARNGEEGIDMALEHIPDIIISDVMMPFKNGYEVCDTLKSDQRTSHIPIILLTAKAALKSRIEGFEKGADAYLSKPFSAEELSLQTSNLIQTVTNARSKYNELIKSSDSKDFETNKETLFLKTVKEAIEAKIDDVNLTAQKLAELIFISKSQLYRKLLALTGCSISEFIRTTRLAKGKVILKEQKVNISEAAYSVGMNPAYFSKMFKELYGYSPKEYVKQASVS